MVERAQGGYETTVTGGMQATDVRMSGGGSGQQNAREKREWGEREEYWLGPTCHRGERYESGMCGSREAWAK
jgi:hypothetical protein